MTRSVENNDEARRVWDESKERQEFEHQLIDRKTTWLLTSEAILFAAYGVTFRSGETVGEVSTFRSAVGWAGLAIAAACFIGVLAVVNSKRLWWRMYANLFDDRSNWGHAPEPFSSRKVPWGPSTANTLATLVPDMVTPIVFIVAWSYLILND
jgi:hypothetical protein